MGIKTTVRGRKKVDAAAKISMWPSPNDAKCLYHDLGTEDVSVDVPEELNVKARLE
jgi:hypothetical protein